MTLNSLADGISATHDVNVKAEEQAVENDEVYNELTVVEKGLNERTTDSTTAFLFIFILIHFFNIRNDI